ncbi:MAG: hypothetical protein ACI857_000379 [Arenicella sp.]|jgi:hypothetical protein
MDKELKISISIFLVFFIFGLTSFFNSGSFATPIFMQHFILVPLSLIFFFMNTKEKHSILLLIYFLVCVAALIIDEFSQLYLANKFEFNALYDFSKTDGFSIFFLIFYFGFFVSLGIYLWYKNKQLILAILQLALIALGLILMFSETRMNYASYAFTSFLLVFILNSNRFSKEDSKVVNVLSAQFTLLFLLQLCQYFI